MNPGLEVPTLPSYEFVLDFRDGRWRAERNGRVIEAGTLDEMDRALCRELRRLAGSGSEVEAAVRFDLAALPAWLRQYHTHYFNYRLRLAAGEEPA